MADITIPNAFVPHTKIESAQVNENFSALASGAFNKTTGDTVHGPTTFDSDVTITGTLTGAVVVAAEDLTGTTLPATVTGSSLTSVGTITTGTWNAGLDAAELTSGTVDPARITSLNPGNFAVPTISQWSNDAQYLTASSVAGVPPGAIAMYGGATAPVDWLLCQGQSLLVADYTPLHAAIGYRYGGADASFNVPNLQQRFPLGLAASGTGSTLGDIGGLIDHVHSGPDHVHTLAHTHTYTTVIAHQHTITDPQHAHTYSTTSGGGSGYTAGDDFDTSVTSATTVAQSTGIEVNSYGSASGTTSATSVLTTGQQGTGNTSAVNPPFLTVNFIIKL